MLLLVGCWLRRQGRGRVVERPMVQSLSPSSRSPQALETNLLEVAATAGNLLLASGPPSLISSPRRELGEEQSFL